MKLVVVSQRVDAYPDRRERRDAIDQRLVTFLLAAEFLPVPVPNRLFSRTPDNQLAPDGLGDWLQTLKPNAIVLSGGNDIGNCIERDLTESYLLDYASVNRIPLLGICRGMQMMGVFAGTKLKLVSGHVGSRHHINGRISGEVNSFHKQSLVDCPSEYEVLATAEDNEIEAIGHKSLPWQGWMWHPEREESFNILDIKRLKLLFSRAPVP